PGNFRTVSLFFYPEIRLSLFPMSQIKKKIWSELPDHIHIATEGPLGLAARRFCKKTGLRFSTSYHTHFHYYMGVRLRPLQKMVERYLRWFHNAAEVTMVSTPGLG